MPASSRCWGAAEQEQGKKSNQAQGGSRSIASGRRILAACSAVTVRRAVQQTTPPVMRMHEAKPAHTRCKVHPHSCGKQQHQDLCCLSTLLPEHTSVAAATACGTVFASLRLEHTLSCALSSASRQKPQHTCQLSKQHVADAVNTKAHLELLAEQCCKAEEPQFNFQHENKHSPEDVVAEKHKHAP